MKDACWERKYISAECISCLGRGGKSRIDRDHRDASLSLSVLRQVETSFTLFIEIHRDEKFPKTASHVWHLTWLPDNKHYSGKKVQTLGLVYLIY